MLANKLMSALSGGAEGRIYVDDVFSAYTYTDNASIQTITNGIDLAGKGGLVWTKRRGNLASHFLLDTVRGGNNALRTDEATANLDVTPGITFGSSGYTIDQSQGYLQVNGNSSISWTFRKAPKFFDVVTWTGNDLNPRVMNHSLGASPGMMIVKTTSGVGSSNWNVYHRSLASPKQTLLTLNTVDAASNQGFDYWIDQNESSFIPSSNNNFSGRTYVAYLFAHDPSADGIIQCGSFTTDASGNATVNLGWEPQYVLVKKSAGTGDWFVFDSMRGMANWLGGGPYLSPNHAAAEVADGVCQAQSMGFMLHGSYIPGSNPSQPFIYLAIRRPNKPPTTGTEVYNAIARTGTGAATTVTGVGFAPDLVFSTGRNTTSVPTDFVDRLRGPKTRISPSDTSAELAYDSANGPSAFSMDGVDVTVDTAHSRWNWGAYTYINHFFRRAPGFMDVVCYTGTGAARTVPHSLGVAPELMIVKVRNIAGYSWIVYHSALGATKMMVMQAADAPYTNSVYWNDTSPTITVFTVGTDATVNNLSLSGAYVAYLFASLPGISKVGSYTGNGTSQTINCGFTTGARFILIKRTDSAGDWYIWDTARGIVSANDPHLSLNTTAAEVITDDSVDPDVSGFIVNQVAATNINVSGGQYIFLAIA